MNYPDCLNWLERIQSLGIKFGLKNVETLLHAFLDPHLTFPSIVVAGSNGKGSVCSMLSRILTLQGFKTGLYTSPHLVDYEERFRIGDDLIPRIDFCRILTLLREAIDELTASERLEAHPTHFEILTCLALIYFGEQGVDMAVLEVGMGGRFDATNVVVPKLSIITTISLEHQNFLGNSLEQIAFEKAGIIKSGIPVICGVEAPEALASIQSRAEDLQAPLFRVFGPGTEFHSLAPAEKARFEYHIAGEVFRYSPSLQGEHQGRNSAVAIAAIRALFPDRMKEFMANIIHGIESTVWEGRMELVSRHPMILLDGAHNREGAEALRAYLDTRAESPIVLVFAVMRDKDIEKLTKILFPSAAKIILTRVPYHRAADPMEIHRRTDCCHDRIIIEPDTGRALQLAVRTAGDLGMVVVAGSLFLIGEVKRLLGEPDFQ